MYRDNKENILLKSKAINLLPTAKVLIIGGGRAGYIKLKSFLKSGFSVDILSPLFTEEILELSCKHEKMSLIEGEYDKKHICNYEIVVIGTNSSSLNKEIALDCEEIKRVYLYLPDCKAGKFSVPVEVETENIKLSIGTRGGSPKTALFLARRLRKAAAEYDDFVEYICTVRNSISDSRLKREVMEFLNTEEFYELYRAGKGEVALKNFYGGGLIEYSGSD